MPSHRGSALTLTAARAPSLEPAAMLKRAQEAERDGHRAVARNLYEQCIRGHLRAMSPAQICSALVGIARMFQLEGDSAAALDTLTAAAAVAHLHGDESSRGAALNVEAVVHWQRGNLDQAERLYQLAQACGLRSGDGRLVAMTAQNLGIIANVRGELTQALGHYNASLAAFRALRLDREVCNVLSNLGKLHTDLEQWEDAERVLTEASRLAESAADTHTCVLIDVNVAELAIRRRDYQRARVVCERALRTSLVISDDSVEAELRKQLGVVARETGHSEQAERQFALSEAVAAQRENVLLQAELARERADLLARGGRFRETVQNLQRAHRLFTDLRARRDVADVDRRYLRIENTFLDVVRRWGESIESKDSYTQGHCLRVADLTCAVARRMGIDDHRLFWIRVGALLHDVGKIVVPAEILNKAGPLTSEEWALMRSHPEAGVELLRGIDFPEDVLPIVLSHHERWNGSGYPHGLAGDAVPLPARILGIADVYDALTTERSYKPGLSHERAMAIMKGNVGTHFDPSLFERFEQVVEAGEELLPL